MQEGGVNRVMEAINAPRLKERDIFLT